MTIIVTGATITATQAQRMQEGGTLRRTDRSGKFMPQISCNKHGINNKTAQKNLQAEQKRTKNTAVVTRMPRVMCNNCWTSRKSSSLAEPVTPSLVTTEQVRATTTKTTMLLVIQK
jgi:hypothetical protein